MNIRQAREWINKVLSYIFIGWLIIGTVVGIVIIGLGSGYFFGHYLILPLIQHILHS